MKKRYILVWILLLMVHMTNAQYGKKSKFLMGITINPILPNNLIQNNDIKQNADTLSFHLLQKPAISYGLEIRYNFHERFSFHAGINYANRNFKVDVFEDDSVHVDTVLKFISYDIPVFVSGYVKLTKDLYLNGNLGLSMDFYPTDIIVPHVYGKRYHWAQFSAIGGTGVELRTERSGYFYLGMSYKAHFHDMLYVLFYQDDVIGSADKSLPYSGNYFSVNLKYYLP